MIASSFQGRFKQSPPNPLILLGEGSRDGSSGRFKQSPPNPLILLGDGSGDGWWGEVPHTPYAWRSS